MQEKKITHRITHGITNEQQTNNKQITTTKEIKKEKNIYKNNNSSSSSNNNIAKIDKLMVECLRTTNINNIKECIEYLDKLPIELIEYALKKTSRTDRPSWKYAMRILDDYTQKQYTSIEQVKADELSFKSKRQPIEETDEERRERKIRELKEMMGNG